MTRVENDEEWTLFCPSRVPHLIELIGTDFESEYKRLEKEGYGKSKISARDLWRDIIDSTIECGGPSILFKDTINGEIWNTWSCPKISIAKT
jgi:ribonucleotide reductase alpha subunit